MGNLAILGLAFLGIWILAGARWRRPTSRRWASAGLAPHTPRHRPKTPVYV